MKVEHLISCVSKDPRELAKQMNLQTDAVIVNQKSAYSYEEFTENGHRVRAFSMDEQGVGLSRNTAMQRSRGDIVLFGDEDIVYAEGAAKAVADAFAAHPEADLLLFNVEVSEERRTYWITSETKVRLYNCGRYPAYAVAARRESLQEANLSWHLWFGGGARYSNGEDSLFLSDALKKGLKIIAVPEVIGREIPRPSTWFTGYNEKFFYDRGVLYRYLYGGLAPVMACRWLLKGKHTMFGEISFGKAKELMKEGIRRGGRNDEKKQRRA
ncbi:MAG: glycosyltransferase family 2 protein [Lachnospiraceae bacterium]|nr:glycosyltransferase family 2 protein [Lachnospiraceae bacterium]